MKKLLSLSLMLVLSACSANAPTVIKENVLSPQVKVNQLKNDGIIAKDAKEVFIADVGNKNGASFSVNIDLSDSSFKTKASVSGTPAKIGTDIKSLKVYLIKNSGATYPLAGDPLGATDLVAGPFNLDRTGAGPYTVTFTNVGISPAGTTYFAAVRAFDTIGGTGAELIKANNASATAWTGTTAATNKVAVSTGAGVGVNASLVVSTTTALPVTLNLLDAVGATIESTVTPNSGSNTLPAVTAS